MNVEKVFTDKDDTPPGERIGRTNARQNASRDAGKRETTAETRGLSRADLVNKFRTEMFSNVLPRTPEIPGYHVCWLSTTNPYDSLSHRESIGYERVKPEDLPGFDHITLTQGPFAGCIGLNEMILAKIPMDLWQDYMHIAHHERPYGEEEKIREAVRYMQETARDGGGDVYLGDGTNEIVHQRRNRAPTFSE